MEHLLERGDVARIPTADIVIERCCVEKHRPHRRDLSGVPIGNILIEGTCSGKHGRHSGHIFRIPVAEGLVELRGAPKDIRHGSDIGNIPIPNIGWPVEVGTVGEHTMHRLDGGQIGQVRGGTLQIGAACEGHFHGAPGYITPLIHGNDLFPITCERKTDPVKRPCSGRDTHRVDTRRGKSQECIPIADEIAGIRGVACLLPGDTVIHTRCRDQYLIAVRRTGIIRFPGSDKRLLGPDTHHKTKAICKHQ